MRYIARVFCTVVVCLVQQAVLANPAKAVQSDDEAVGAICANWLKELDHSPLTKSEAENVCRDFYFSEETHLKVARHFACVENNRLQAEHQGMSLTQAIRRIEICKAKAGGAASVSRNGAVTWEALTKSPLGKWPPRSAVSALDPDSKITAEIYCQDMTDRVVQKDQGGVVFYEACTDFILSNKAQIPFYEYQACLVEQFSAALADGKDTNGEDAESRDLRQGIFDQCHSSVDGGDEAIRQASIEAQKYARRSAPWWKIKREKPLFGIDESWKPVEEFETPNLLEADAAWVGERAYPAEFQNPQLNPKLLENIKRFDLLAFAPEQNTFWGVAERPNMTPAQKEYATRRLVTIRFHADIQGSISRSNWFRGLKVGGVRMAAQKLADNVDVLLLSPSSKDGLLTSVSKQKIADFMPNHNVNELLSQMISIDDGRCRIYREGNNYAIAKTIVLVPFADRYVQEAEPLKATIACIARGFYYHLGMNNVLNIPNKYFVAWRRYDQSIGLDRQNDPNFLPWLVNGSAVGKSRDEILLRYLNVFTPQHKKGS